MVFAVRTLSFFFLAVLLNVPSQYFRGRIPVSSEIPAAYSPWTLPTRYAWPTHNPQVGCEDIAYNTTPTGTCKNIVVNHGESFRTAIDNLRCNATVTDMITLQAQGVGGTGFTSGYYASNLNFELTNKHANCGDAGDIYVVSSALDDFPSYGNRAVPLGLSFYPPNVSGNTPRASYAKLIGGPVGDAAGCLFTSAGAHHWRFVGIECVPPSGEDVGFLIRIGQSGSGTEISAEADQVHDIVFDRCYVAGDPTVGSHAGFLIHGDKIAVVNSFIHVFDYSGNETQGFLIYAGASKVELYNNAIGGGGENFFLAGAAHWDSTVQNRDVTVYGNLIYKDPAWRDEFPDINVKNLWELKNGKRVLIFGNVMTHSWVSFQETAGSVKIGGELPVDEDTDDLTFEFNIVIHVANFYKVCAQDCSGDIPNAVSRVYIGNNLAYDVSTVNWADSSTTHGKGIYLYSATENHVYDHNTVISDQNAVGTMIQGPGPQHVMVLRDSIFVDTGSNKFSNTMINNVHSSSTVTGNVLIGGSCGSLPGGNNCPSAIEDVEFENVAGNDYRLASGSPYKAACSDTYGAGTTDCGANVTAINAATACVVSGQCAASAPAPLAILLNAMTLMLAVVAASTFRRKGLSSELYTRTRAVARRN